MLINRITWHHPGGNYVPNAKDLKSYHRLVTGDGEVVNGKHPILANAAGRKLVAGRYAPHTLSLNSGNLGMAICGMVGGTWENPRASRAFPRLVQVDALIADTVLQCREFGIVPTREHTLSHAEVEPTLGVKQRDKWDFDYQIRNTGGRDPIAIGDELRQEVMMQLGGKSFAPAPPTAPAFRPTVRQGSQGPDVVDLQKALQLKPDGLFGPRTRAALMAFQKRNQLLPDGIAGRMTWAALGI